MKHSKELKRQLIEQEIKGIILSDSRAILIDNLRRRKRRLGNISLGDSVFLCEYVGSRKKDRDTDSDCLYRIIEGKIIQVTKHGFFIEGNGPKDKTIREFVNKAHIINGSVQLLLKEITNEQ